jgi:hypothetical protein
MGSISGNLIRTLQGKGIGTKSQPPVPLQSIEQNPMMQQLLQGDDGLAIDKAFEAQAARSIPPVGIARKPLPDRDARGPGPDDTFDTFTGTENTAEQTHRVTRHAQEEADEIEALKDRPLSSRKEIERLEKAAVRLELRIKAMFKDGASLDAVKPTIDDLRRVKAILQSQGPNPRHGKVDVFSDAPEGDILEDIGVLRTDNSNQLRTHKPEQLNQLDEVLPKARRSKDEELLSDAALGIQEKLDISSGRNVDVGPVTKGRADLAQLGPTKARGRVADEARKAGRRLETNEEIQDIFNRFEEVFPEFNSQGKLVRILDSSRGIPGKGRKIKEHSGRQEISGKQGERNIELPKEREEFANSFGTLPQSLTENGPNRLGEMFDPSATRIEQPGGPNTRLVKQQGKTLPPFDEETEALLASVNEDVLAQFQKLSAAQKIVRAADKSDSFPRIDREVALEEIREVDQWLHSMESNQASKVDRPVDTRTGPEFDRNEAGLMNTILPDQFKEEGFANSPNPKRLTDPEKLQRKQGSGGNVVEPQSHPREKPFSMFDTVPQQLNLSLSSSGGKTVEHSRLLEALQRIKENR